MKKIILTLKLMVLLACSVHAQSMYGDEVKADIKMKYVFTFEEALKKAREENKLIFFNCFADWAIPCHAMNKKVFSDQKFADWMDKNFVNFFTDVTKGDGKALAAKYDTKTMAQYLVLNANGEIVHRIVGGSEIPVFQALLKKALNPKTSLAGMNKRFEGGERNLNFLRDYYEVLKTANEDKKAKEIADQAFAKIKQTDWQKKENYKVFLAQVKNSNDQYFQYVVNHKKDFAKQNGDSLINNLLSKVYFNELYKYALGETAYNGNKFLEFSLGLQRANLPENDNVFTIYEFAKLRGEGNIVKMLDVLQQKMAGWQVPMINLIDLSFAKLQGLSKEDKPLVIAYLEAKASKQNGGSAGHLKSVIRKLDSKDGIRFADLSFEEALKKAAAENKIVFMDCFTTWCGPCKWLDANTFTKKEVGDYFNKNFVNLQMDMEKGEGKDLLKKYGIKAFPTLLLLKPDGTEMGRVMGAVDEKKLLNEVKKVIDAQQNKV